MLNNTPIEETFRTAFDNFEADVNAQVWTNIEQQIATPAAPSAGNAASEAARTIASASKFSALSYGIASTVVIAIAVATYFYFADDKKVTSTATNPTTKQQPVTSDKELSPVQNITADTKHENKLTSQKQNDKLSDEQIPHVGGVAPATVDQSNVSDIDAPTTATSESKQALNTNDTPSQPKDNMGVSEPATANDKHETTIQANGQIDNQPAARQDSTQSDDIDWGVIANSITPNNDGLNDVFAIRTSALKSLEVTILDRNGKTIYKWNNINGFWDGKDFNGKEMPAGVYLYYIFAQSADGKPHLKRGTLNIFR